MGWDGMGYVRHVVVPAPAPMFTQARHIVPSGADAGAVVQASQRIRGTPPQTRRGHFEKRTRRVRGRAAMRASERTGRVRWGNYLALARLASTNPDSVHDSIPFCSVLFCSAMDFSCFFFFFLFFSLFPFFFFFLCFFLRLICCLLGGQRANGIAIASTQPTLFVFCYFSRRGVFLLCSSPSLIFFIPTSPRSSLVSTWIGM